MAVQKINNFESLKQILKAKADKQPVVIDLDAEMEDTNDSFSIGKLSFEDFVD